jgi:hypothetical protein
MDICAAVSAGQTTSNTQPMFLTTVAAYTCTPSAVAASRFAWSTTPTSGAQDAGLHGTKAIVRRLYDMRAAVDKSASKNEECGLPKLEHIYELNWEANPVLCSSRTPAVGMLLPQVSRLRAARSMRLPGTGACALLAVAHAAVSRRRPASMALSTSGVMTAGRQVMQLPRWNSAAAAAKVAAVAADAAAAAAELESAAAVHRTEAHQLRAAIEGADQVRSQGRDSLSR